MAERLDLRRVVVIGSSGAGKTTFAGELAACLSVPHVQLDALYWEANWTAVDKEIFRQRVIACAADDQWVADGNYRSVRDVLWARATTIVWLDYSFPRVFSRLVGRTVRRAWTREEIFSGNRESWRMSFADKESVIWWMLKTWRRHQRDFGELMRDPAYAHATRVSLCRPESGTEFHRRATAALVSLSD
ncbi:MAG: hypothetical protein QM803_01545 [Rhodocyclaceae bacterium]